MQQPLWKRALKVLGYAVVLAVTVFVLVLIFRSDPLGPIAGRKLSGPLQPYPNDWTFSNEHFLVYVETRPEEPHSVTTVAFIHDGTLHVPAMNGSEKDWTGYAVADPRVRIKIGDNVYPGHATRVVDLDEDAVVAAAAKKYSQMAEEDFELPEDVWLFRIDPPPDEDDAGS